MKRALGIALLLLAAGAATVARAQDPTLAEELPDVVLSDDIRSQAAALGNDAVRIYEFVRNEFAFQPYYGLLKGPEQTLLSRAGNDYDLAALLVSLLRGANIPARFARGQIVLSGSQATQWLCVDDVAAAANYLFASGPLANAVTIEQTGDELRRLHVWVEAKVPLARYRGNSGGATASSSWVALDPSFKASDCPVDPGLPIDDSTHPDTFSFDEVGPGGYLRTDQARLPHEAFEDQVREFLAGTTNPAWQGKSLTDVSFRPKIRKQEPRVLPTSLPYDIVEDPSNPFSAQRDASLVRLHDETHFGHEFKKQFRLAGPIDLSSDVLQGELDYRYLWTVDICEQDIVPLACVVLSGSSRLMSYTGVSAEVAGSRITLSFPAVAGTVGREGYADCTPGIVTQPTLWVDGVAQVDPAVQTVALCDPVLLVIGIIPPLNLFNERHLLRPKLVLAGGTYAPVFQAFASSRAQTTRISDSLFQAASDHPIALDAGDPFIDANRDGVKDPVELWLGEDFDAQEALIGGLLNLAGYRYLELYGEARSSIRAIHHKLPLFLPMAGSVDAGLDVEFLFDSPFGARPANLLVDLALLNLAARRDTGLGDSRDHDDRISLLGGSAAEHAVWEEIVAVPAISTVSGFQRAIDLGGLDLLHVTDAAEADAATTSCDGTTCSDIDDVTYCLVKAAFGPEGAWKASSWDVDGYCESLGAAFPFDSSFVASELTVLDESAFTFSEFTGFVYRVFGDTSGAAVSAYFVQPVSAGGGFVAGTCIASPFLEPCSSLDEFDLVDRYFPPDPLFTVDPAVLDPTFFDFELADPVSTFTGNFFQNNLDLQIAGRAGHNLRLIRSYNAQSTYDGPLGFGWIHTFDQHLSFDERDPADPDDDRVLWIDEGGRETSFFDDGVGGFDTNEWTHHTLARETDGSLTLTLKDGTVYHFHQELGTRADLDYIEDRNGNRITCVYIGGQLDRVRDTAGRDLIFRHDINGHLYEIEDWTGRHWRYTIDANGDLTEYLDPVQAARDDAEPGSGRPWKYEYYSGLANSSLNHNLRRWIRPADRDGDGEGDVWMEFLYYETDRVYRHTNSLGETTTFDYNYFRQRTSVTQPDGTVEQHFYDLYGNVVKQVSGRGIVRDYTYDEFRRDRIAELDGFGYESTAEYDDRGNMIQRTDRLGGVETWTYNQFSQPLTHTDRSGRRQRWIYDATGNLKQHLAGIPPDLKLLVEYEHDSVGNLVEERRHSGVPGAPAEVTLIEPDTTGTAIAWIRDPVGTQTAFTTDALGRAVARRRARTVEGQPFPETITEESVYDELDRVVRRVDPVGTAAEQVFDENGLTVERRTIVPRRAGGSPIVRVDQRTTYDAADQPVQLTDAIGDVDTFAYDSRGRPVSLTTPLGHVIRYEYDADGNVVAVTDATGARSTREYDAENRLTRTVDPLGRVNTGQYDREGRLIRRIGPGGRLLREALDYDPEGRVLREADGEGRAVLRTHDPFGRVETSTSPVGADPGPVTYPFPLEQSTTRFSYDRQGRLLSRTRAEGDSEERTESIRYNANGRPVAYTDALGRTSTRSYDELGSLVGTRNAAGEVMAYSYDPRGLMLTRRGTGADGFSVSDRFAYDAFGRLILAKNGEATQTFRYDDLDRLVAVYDPHFGTARRSYDADGRVRQLVAPDDPALGFPTGMVTTYQYDARGRITSIADTVAGTWQFEYDAVGRLVRRSDADGYVQKLLYTPEGFVDRIELQGPSGLIDAITYSDYDTLGNSHQMTTNEGLTVYDYDARNRLTLADHPGSAIETFVYDRVGNRIGETQDGVARTYEVDAADQLLRILGAGGEEVERFEYDAVGRRTTRQVGGMVQAEYRYDPLSRLREVQNNAGAVTTALGYDAQGSRTRRSETGAPTALFFGEWIEYRDGDVVRLVHGGTLDGVLAEVVGTDVRRLLTDGSHNVVHVASDAPATYERRYGAFGAVRSSRDAVPVERGFAGRPTEGSTGLLNARARHYDPATGRFLQTDPLGIESNQPYAYAASNPVVFGDPLGLDPTEHSISSEFGWRPAGPPQLWAAWREHRNAIGGTIPTAALGTVTDWTGASANYWAGAAADADDEEGLHALLMARSYLEISVGFHMLSTFTDPVEIAFTILFGGANRFAPVPKGRIASLVARQGSPIFRGVPRTHHAFEDALRGTARPGNLRGHIDAELHNLGATTNSQFTSWTRSREVARSYAGEDGVILEWHTGLPPPDATWRFVWSPDEFREEEILIQGLLEGAKVTKP